MLVASREGQSLRAVLAGACRRWPRSVWRCPALDSPATYLNWNFILISIPNVLMILGMVVVFVIALLAPFPAHGEAVELEDGHDA